MKFFKTDFRPLSDDEMDCVVNAQFRYLKKLGLEYINNRLMCRGVLRELLRKKRLKVVFGFNGDNFTHCVIQGKRTLHVGVAKKNPKDKSNSIIGARLALSRAAKSINLHYEEE